MLSNDNKEYERLCSEKTELQNKIQDLNNQKDSAQLSLESLKLDHEEELSKLNSKLEELTNQTAQIETLTTEVETLKAERSTFLSEDKKKYENFCSKKNDLQEKIQSLSDENSAIQLTLELLKEDHEKELSALKSKILSEQSTEIDTYTKEISAQKSEIKFLKEKLESQAKFLQEELENQISHYKNQQKVDKNEIEMLKFTISEKDKEAGEFTDRLKELNKEITALKAEQCDVKVEILKTNTAHQTELHEMKLKVSATEAEVRRIEKSKSEVEATIDRYRETIQELEYSLKDQEKELISKFQSEITSLKTQLETSRNRVIETPVIQTVPQEDPEAVKQLELQIRNLEKSLHNAKHECSKFKNDYEVAEHQNKSS